MEDCGAVAIDAVENQAACGDCRCAFPAVLVLGRSLRSLLAAGALRRGQGVLPLTRVMRPASVSSTGAASTGRSETRHCNLPLQGPDIRSAPLSH
jgi:hypothetical protein